MAVKARGDITLIRVDDGAAGEDGQMLYAISSTAESTAAKAAALATGTLNLKAGVTVAVRFIYSNTAASPTLNVAGTGAKAIYTQGVRYAYWSAGATVVFTYDGSCWRVASEPVYANTATIGNPAGGNVYVDGNSVNIMDALHVLARFGAHYVNGEFYRAYLRSSNSNGLYIGTKAPDESGALTSPHLSISGSGIFTQDGEVGIKKSFASAECKTGDTWIDGKTIYQKTINVGAISNTTKRVDHGVTDISEIWVDTANSFLKASSGARYSLPRVSTTALNQQVEVSVSATQIVVAAGTNASFEDCYVTLRYTKMTE